MENDFLPFGSMPDIVSSPPIIACGASPDDLIPLCDSISKPVISSKTPKDDDVDDEDDEVSTGRYGKKRRSPRFLTGGSSVYAFSAFFTQLMFRTGRGELG